MESLHGQLSLMFSDYKYVDLNITSYREDHNRLHSKIYMNTEVLACETITKDNENIKIENILGLTPKCIINKCKGFQDTTLPFYYNGLCANHSFALNQIRRELNLNDLTQEMIDMYVTKLNNDF